MASTLPAVCFIRCPNCFRVLAEFPDIPPSKCYACDAILIAKMHSDNCYSDDGLPICPKQISDASDESDKLELVGKKRSEDSKPYVEENLEELESSENGIVTISVSESNGSSKRKIESVVNERELNDINERSLEQEKAECIIRNVRNPNEEVKKSFNQIVPAASDSLNLTCEVEEQSPGSLDHDIKKNDGNEEHINSTGFSWKTRSSHAHDRSFSVSDKQPQCPLTQKKFAVSRRTRSSHSYDRSFSLSDEQGQNHVPQKHLAVSRRTRSSKLMDSPESIEAAGRDTVMKSSAIAKEQVDSEKHHSKFSTQSSGNGVQANEQNTLFSSESHELSSISQSKNAEEVVKFHFSETDDQLKILDKVDELKFELLRIMSGKSDGKGASGISIKVTQFEGIIESNGNKSSLLRYSKQPSNTSCLLCQSSAICCHNGKRRICQDAQIRHCRPVSGGAPFVICYKCYKLLQLPVDFLVSLKRIHKLRCGSCSEVLVYSFRPRSLVSINKRS